MIDDWNEAIQKMQGLRGPVDNGAWIVHRDPARPWRLSWEDGRHFTIDRAMPGLGDDLFATKDQALEEVVRQMDGEIDMARRARRRAMRALGRRKQARGGK